MWFQLVTLHLGLWFGQGVALQVQRTLHNPSSGDISINKFKTVDNTVNGRRVDCSPATLAAFRDELAYIHEWLQVFPSDTLRREDPLASAFVPEGTRETEEKFRVYLENLKQKLFALYQDLDNPDRPFDKNRPDVPIICPVTTGDKREYCGPGYDRVLASWHLPDDIFRDGVLALCPLFENTPSTRTKWAEPDNCSAGKTLDRYDSRGITILHELMHDKTFLDTVDVSEAYGPFCCQALANCDPDPGLKAARYGRNSDSVAWLIAGFWWQKQRCGGRVIPMPSGNFAADCSELYFSIYRDQRTTTTVTETETEDRRRGVGMHADTLFPQWITPAYCSRTPGVLSTVTTTETTTTTLWRKMEEALPQQTVMLGVNIDL